MLHGAMEVRENGATTLSRRDAVAELLHAIPHLKSHRISPAMFFSYSINCAPSAMSTIVCLLSSDSDRVKPVPAALWIELGAVPALTLAMESHAASDIGEFGRTGVLTPHVPLWYSAIAISLLEAAASAGAHVPRPEKFKLANAFLTVFVEKPEWMAVAAGDDLAICSTSRIGLGMWCARYRWISESKLSQRRGSAS